MILRSLPDPILDNLRELIRFRAEMIQEGTTLVNQLRETRSILYPELGRVLTNLGSPTCLALLITYPGLEYISYAGAGRVAETLSIASKGRIGKSLAKVLVEAAQNTVGVPQR